MVIVFVLQLYDYCMVHNNHVQVFDTMASLLQLHGSMLTVMQYVISHLKLAVFCVSIHIHCPTWLHVLACCKLLQVVSCIGGSKYACINS